MKHPCPVGTYGSVEAETSSACSGVCTAGYFCPAGSTGPKQEPCGQGLTPAIYYCPEGTTERQIVSDGYYTTPEDSLPSYREAQALSLIHISEPTRPY